MTVITLAIILFFIMDPIGNITSLLKLTEGIPKKRRHYVILREMIIALFVMILFSYFGDLIFSLLHISNISLNLTSGLILLLVAMKIIFQARDSFRMNLPEGEPFITPLAVPLIAGPSLLATIMLFSEIEPSNIIMLTAILIAWSISCVILFFGTSIQKILTVNGLNACERLIGMVLFLIAVQRILEGLQLYIETHHPLT
jgi:multiple antibiotic resistance protein